MKSKSLFILITTGCLFVFSVPQLTILGTSNVKNHPNELKKMKRDLNLEITLFPTYTWSQLQENIKKVNPHSPSLLLHILGNDARNIAINNNLDKPAKLQQALALAEKFVDFTNDFATKNPKCQVFFSTLLFRNDGVLQEFLRKKMNSKIIEKLNKVYSSEIRGLCLMK